MRSHNRFIEVEDVSLSMNVKVRKMSPTFLFALLTLLILGHPKPKTDAYFSFCWHI